MSKNIVEPSTHSLLVEIRDVTTIIPYARNPRKNRGAVAKVKASIKEFGFKQPIVVDADGVIIAGHTRYEAALSLKYRELPVIVASDLTPIQVKAYRIADNKVADFSEWDDDFLKLEMQDIASVGHIDLSVIGFDDSELKKLLDDFEKEEVKKDGEDNEYKEITFKLHREQLSVLEDAMGKSIELGPFEEPINKNTDANALTRICETFIRLGN